MFWRRRSAPMPHLLPTWTTLDDRFTRGKMGSMASRPPGRPPTGRTENRTVALAPGVFDRVREGGKIWMVMEQLAEMLSDMGPGAALAMFVDADGRRSIQAIPDNESGEHDAWYRSVLDRGCKWMSLLDGGVRGETDEERRARREAQREKIDALYRARDSAPAND